MSQVSQPNSHRRRQRTNASGQTGLRLRGQTVVVMRLPEQRSAAPAQNALAVERPASAGAESRATEMAQSRCAGQGARLGAVRSS
jgi:folate-dependent tRNA-U54 methylase TrmFO/GidA